MPPYTMRLQVQMDAGPIFRRRLAPHAVPPVPGGPVTLSAHHSRVPCRQKSVAPRACDRAGCADLRVYAPACDRAGCARGACDPESGS